MGDEQPLHYGHLRNVIENDAGLSDRMECISDALADLCGVQALLVLTCVTASEIRGRTGDISEANTHARIYARGLIKQVSLSGGDLQ